MFYKGTKLRVQVLRPKWQRILLFWLGKYKWHEGEIVGVSANGSTITIEEGKLSATLGGMGSGQMPVLHEVRARSKRWRDKGRMKLIGKGK